MTIRKTITLDEAEKDSINDTIRYLNEILNSMREDDSIDTDYNCFEYDDIQRAVNLLEEFTDRRTTYISIV